MPRDEAEQAATFEDFPKDFNVTEKATGKEILARCIPLTRNIAKSRIDKLWWEDLPCDKETRRKEPDLSWKWVELLGSLTNSRGGGYVRGWAVEVEGIVEIQGAILYRMNTFSFFKGKDGESLPAIYAAFLATAPRNRDRLMFPELGKFKGIGTGLLKLAIAHSHYIGGEGRVNLSSVDYPSTVKLYEGFGFSAMSQLPEDRLVLMELTKEAAAKNLKEMGLR